MGFMLKKNRVFLTFNKNGLFVVGLGQEEKKIIKNNIGEKRYLHCLQSYNFLKLDPKNCLIFDLIDPKE